MRPRGAEEPAGYQNEWGDPMSAYAIGDKDELDFADPPAVVPTRMGPLDHVLSGGMAPGVHVLMAQPGAGKSALALFVSVLSARSGARVLFASTEMTRQQCIARCSALTAHMTDGLAGFSWSDWERMGAAARDEMSAYRLTDQMKLDYLSRFPAVRAMRELRRTCPGLAIADGDEVASADALAATARVMRSSGMDLLVVDYLQRLRPPEELKDAEQYRQVTGTSMALAALAKELEMPVLVVSSMNREGAASKRATMAGARGSGDVEYDAVSIWHLVRADDGDGTVRELELNVTKNRRGPTTEPDKPIRLRFDPRSNSFGEA